MKRVASFLLLVIVVLLLSSQSMEIIKLSGTIEATVITQGTLFLDGKNLGEVRSSSIVRIKEVDIGQHNLEMQYADGYKEAEVVRVWDKTTSTASFMYEIQKTSIIKATELEAGKATIRNTALARLSIGLVTDVGGIDDRSFNQGTWEGIVRFGSENGLVKESDYRYLESTSGNDYVPNLATFSDEKMDLIVAPGFLFNNAMAEVAGMYPAQKYLIIDSVVQDENGEIIPNVANAVFSEHEGSFLVGVAAGLKAKADGKKVLGFLGGMKFDLIERFQAGFEQGVRAVYPEASILVDYAGDFGDPGKGQAIARKQFNAGAYIIYHCAGGTGNGMIREAKERSERGMLSWAIGVDRDQYSEGKYGVASDKSAVLTSMVKRVDVAVYEVARITKGGKFPGGQVLVFGVKQQGVGIPVKNPNLTDSIVMKVREFEARIASGDIIVSERPGR